MMLRHALATRDAAIDATAMILHIHIILRQLRCHATHYAYHTLYADYATTPLIHIITPFSPYATPLLACRRWLSLHYFAITLRR